MFDAVRRQSDPDLIAQTRLPTSAEAASRLHIPQERVLCESVESGADEVFRRARVLFESEDVIVIALGGPSRSGKGFLMEKLRSMAAAEGIGMYTLPMDRFYLLKEQRAALEALIGREVTFDDPESIWYERLHLTLNALKAGATDVLLPNYLYDRQGPDRSWDHDASLPSQQKKLYVVDGIFAGHPAGGVPDIADIQVHMHADGATQAARRIQVDRERGRKTVDAAHIFLDFVAKKRNEHIDPFANGAHVAIKNTMPPHELMQRAPRRDQRKMLVSHAHPDDVERLLQSARENGFVESGYNEFVDIYTAIHGRSEKDYARLRFAQGDKGIHGARLTLSLHTEDGANYKGDYDLYPQAEHARTYQEGMMASFEVDRAIAVWKRRITMVCGSATVFVDSDVLAGNIEGKSLPLERGKLVPPAAAVPLSSQVETIDASFAQVEQMERMLKDIVGGFAQENRNTFEMAKDALK